MKEYQIELETENCRTPIDIVTAENGYTAEKYILDCYYNADIDWLNMIRQGTMIVIPIDD